MKNGSCSLTSKIERVEHDTEEKCMLRTTVQMAKGSKCSSNRASMKATSPTACAMGLAEASLQREICTKEALDKIQWTVRASMFTQTGGSTKESGKTTKSMAKAHTSGLMGRFIKETLSTMSALELASCFTLTESALKESGVMEKSMEEAFTSSLTDAFTKSSTKRERNKAMAKSSPVVKPLRKSRLSTSHTPRNP
jgi:hypothetical protein